MRPLLLLLLALRLTAADGPREGTSPFWGVKFLREVEDTALEPIPGGPAARHGLSHGDVVVNFDGRPVGTKIDLIRALAALTWEEPAFTVVVHRGQEEVTIETFVVWVRDPADVDELKLAVAAMERRLEAEKVD